MEHDYVNQAFIRNINRFTNADQIYEDNDDGVLYMNVSNLEENVEPDVEYCNVQTRKPNTSYESYELDKENLSDVDRNPSTIKNCDYTYSNVVGSNNLDRETPNVAIQELNQGLMINAPATTQRQEVILEAYYCNTAYAIAKRKPVDRNACISKKKCRILIALVITVLLTASVTFAIAHFSRIWLIKESVQSRYVYHEVGRKWKYADAFCKYSYNGRLATAKELRNNSEIYVKDKTIWTASYTTLSPWMVNYGCFMYQDRNDSNRPHRILQHPKSANCQQYCNGNLYFGLVEKECVCFGNDIKDLKNSSTSSLECSRKCMAISNDYCGGDERINIYRTMKTGDIVENYKQHLCLSLQCDQGKGSHFYFPHDCSENLSIICGQYPEVTFGNWSDGLDRCKIANETLPIGQSNRQRLCNHTHLQSKFWTGGFRQVIKKSVKGDTEETAVTINCISFNIFNKSQLVDDCNKKKPFVCSIKLVCKIAMNRIALPN